MSLSEAAVQDALRQLVDPNTGKDFVATRSARNVKVTGEDVSLDIELGYPGKSQVEPIRRQVAQALRQAGARNVAVNVASKVVAHAVQRGVKLIPGIKNIIAVASGKGGVGKSTTAVNLALALASEGASVGVLDADIYGPSQPMMLGIAGRPESKDGKHLEPMEGHGLQAISIGFLIDVDTPMVWRGPMVTQALEQLLKDTSWRDLDYLVVDLPPGTGDIQLTLAQKVPVTGAVIVTTPQDIALIDARKGLKMFEKVGIPILAWWRTCRSTSVRNAATKATSSAPEAPRECAATTARSSSASCRSTRRSAARPTRASRPWCRSPMARSPRSTGASRGAAR